MGKRKNTKKFIEKKNAASFRIVHRPGIDPEADGEDNKYVLQPVFHPRQETYNIPKDFPEDLIAGEENYDDGAMPSMPRYIPEGPPGALEHEYDYTQHLREVGSGHYIQCEFTPELAFEARNQQAKGVDKDLEEIMEQQDAKDEKGDGSQSFMSRHAYSGPTEHIKAGHDFFTALEGEQDEDFEDIDDDFVTQAMFGGEDDEEDYREEKEIDFGDYRDGQDGNSDFSEEESDEEDEDDDDDDMRPKRDIDDHFDKILDEYDDQYLGELSENDEDLMGNVENIEQYQEDIDAFANRNKEDYAMKEDENEEMKKIITEKLEDLAIELADETDDVVNEKIAAMFPKKVVEKWDAESIVSTYSNLENHPTLIKRIRTDPKKRIELSKKTGIPLNVLEDRRRQRNIIEEEEEEEEEDDDEEDDEEGEYDDNLGKKRNKKETKAEKRARKLKVKADRKARRAQKKAVKGAFKSELSKQTRLEHNQKTKNPVGLKM